MDTRYWWTVLIEAGREIFVWALREMLDYANYVRFSGKDERRVCESFVFECSVVVEYEEKRQGRESEFVSITKKC